MAGRTTACKLAALVFVWALAAVPLAAQEETARLVVTGEARVEAVPDVAAFTAGVQSEAANAAAALAATSATMREVFAALTAAGVAPEDMQTSELSVDPLWDGGAEGRAPRVRGYAATNLVTVRVRDVAGLGALLDTVGAAGANRVFGVRFETAEPRPALDEARRRAVADARARADLLAEAAGVTLGRVLSIREGGAPGPAPMMARADMAMDAPVAPGTIEFEARVEIVFELQ